MRILLIDDHTLIREALSLLLQQLDAEVTVISASTAVEGLAAATHYADLDLILLDLALPDGSGLSALRQLRAVAPTSPVVVVSASLDIADVRGALDEGAAGYIPKTLSSRAMLSALEQILRGDIFVPADLLAAIAGGATRPISSPLKPAHGLTERQIEVLRWLGAGLSNKEIARKLALTEGTVKLHVSAVMRALGARNRTDAVIAAQRLGLI